MIGVDLFCGAGGMTLGFEQAGIEVLAAVEMDRSSAAAHRANFPQCGILETNIIDVSGSKLRAATRLGDSEIDVLFGGPPCQGFSVGGRQDVHDPRNALLQEFARLVAELKPRYFVLENVAGLALTKHHRILGNFFRSIQRAGYSWVEPYQILDAVDYGIPQRRRRLFILGFRHGTTPPRYPEPVRASRRVYAQDALQDLAAIDAELGALDGDIYSGRLGVPSRYARLMRNGSPRSVLTACARSRHTKESVRRFARTQPGGVEPVSRYYRLDPDQPSRTLRAGTGPDHGSHTAPRPIHPAFPRCITVREAARLHSYPDHFLFDPTIWHGFRQVGNSVPPLLAKAVAAQIVRASEGRP
ncbi:MAG: DNA cytosine methyltransferase [Thermoanaerobaculia bacterium]